MLIQQYLSINVVLLLFHVVFSLLFVCPCCFEYHPCVVERWWCGKVWLLHYTNGGLKSKCAAGDFYRIIQAACFPLRASVLNHFWGYVHLDYFIWGLNVLCIFLPRTKNWSHDLDVKLKLTIPFMQGARAINKKNHLWIQNLCSQNYWNILGSHTTLKSLVRNDP